MTTEHALALQYRYFNCSLPSTIPQTSTISIPRIKLKDLNFRNKRRFNELMEKHSFVILTDIGTTNEHIYSQCIHELEAFFTTSTVESRRAFTSKQIYRSETNTPMWYCGYEHTKVRQAFRVHAGQPERQLWPSTEFRSAWLKLMHLLQKICDQSLALTFGYRTLRAHERQDQDFSVCYGLCYPNAQGTGLSETENVFEHVDPSLYVIEPVCAVEGLEVFDLASKQWLSAEGLCEEGKELVLFGGKALEAATNGRIKGTLHRVHRSSKQRSCFIYEQKYEEYFH